MTGLSIADPTIDWPIRGSAETTLCERKGWDRRIIPVKENGNPTTMEAMCKSDLAVNRMLGGDEGFAISISSSGHRISYGGAVFARCGDAMAAAEEMLKKSKTWSNIQTNGFSPQQRHILETIINAAERNGEILLDRIYPS